VFSSEIVERAINALHMPLPVEQKLSLYWQELDRAVRERDIKRATKYTVIINRLLKQSQIVY